MNSNPAGWKSTILALVGFTLLTLAIGIIVIMHSKDPTLDKSSAEIYFAIGISLVSASTVGILAEIFIQTLITKKILNVEGKFLEGVIPKIITTIYEWVNTQGRTVPIEKSTLYELLKIGYLQWFKKEDFTKLGIPSERVAELYQKMQLTEFKEPVCIDFSLTLTYIGKLDSDLTGRDNLINIKTLVEFSAVNTAGKEQQEDRYLNKNGTLVDFTLDIFEIFPSSDEDKKKFLDRIFAKFTIQLENESKPHEVEFVHADFTRYLQTIKEKDAKDIMRIIKEITFNDVEPLANKIYILYHFFEKKSPEISQFYYVIFSPYPIKPQERIHVSYERTHSFAENDWFYMHTKSLTRGLTVQLEGFERTHETNITYFLLTEEPVAKITNVLLTSSSLMLPRSGVIAAWQKKTP